MRLFATTIMAGLMAAGSAWAQDDSAVKIAVLNDQSSSFSVIGGQGSVEAARMAIEDFGGSVLGKPIELLSADHQNKPEVALSIARGWFDNDGVDVIVDIANSSIALGVNSLLAEEKKLGLFVAPGVSRLVEEDCNGYGIAWAYDSPSMARVSALAQVQAGNKKYFILSPDYTSGIIFEDTVRQVVTENGGEVVGAVRAPLGTTDFSSFLLQAQSSGAEVLMLTLNGPELINAVKQIQEFGINQTMKIAAHAINDFEAKGAGAETLKGIQFMLPWNWVLDDQTRAFHKRLMERSGFSATWDHAGVYSAVLNYLKAVEATGSQDAKTIFAKLQEMKIEDVFARNAKLLPNGRLIHDVYVLEIKDPSEVKEEWDMSKLVATIPAEQAFPPLSASKCSLVKAQ